MIEPGSIFDGRYRIESALGSGSFGTVYKAQETALNRVVAIKVLSSWSSAGAASDSLSRFQREAQTLCQLEHSNILKVYRYGIAEGETPFLVMEYFEGESLASLVQRQGALEYKLAFRTAHNLAEALQLAHARGVLHRDLKPENVLVSTKNQNDPQVKLIDFGLCKPDRINNSGKATLTGTGEILGSPDYMSPEQALGQKLDKPSDIFAFGLMLFEMLTGHKPHQADTVAELMMLRISKKLPELLDMNPKSGISPEIDILIQGCTRIQPDSRIQSFDQVLEEIRAIQPGLPAGKFIFSESALKSIGRRKLFSTLSLVLLVILLPVVFFMFNKNPVQSVVQTVETPKQTSERAVDGVKKLLDKHEDKQASALAKEYTRSIGFEKWTPFQQANLHFRFFELFRESADRKSTEYHMLQYFRRAIPMFRSSEPLEPETTAQVKAFHKYLLTGPTKTSRQTWMAVNTEIDNLPWQSHHDVAGIMISEIAAEALLNSYQDPPPEARWKYTKDLGGLVSLSAQLRNDELYDRFSEKALRVSKATGIKRVEAYVYMAMARYEHSKGNLEKALKYNDECNRVLEEIKSTPDAAEVKMSHRVEMYETEAAINHSMSTMYLTKGDKKQAEKYNLLALNSKAQAAKMRKEVSAEEEEIREKMSGWTGRRLAK